MLDDRIHQTHRNYWTQAGQDPVRQHPVIGKKGAELTNAGFTYLEQRVSQLAQKGLINTDNLAGSVMSARTKIRTLEQGHEAKIVEIARNTVMELYDIDPSKLNVTKEELFQFSIGEPDETIIPYNFRESRYKRQVIRESTARDRSVGQLMLSQGAAMQGYLQVWDMDSVKTAVLNIDPANPQVGQKLLDLYKTFSYGTLYGHYVLDLTRVPRGLAPFGGSTRVAPKKTQSNDDDDVNYSERFWNDLFEFKLKSSRMVFEAEGDQPQTKGLGGYLIKASGINLAVLIQEGIKGTVEAILASKSDTGESAPVLSKMSEEIPYFQVGPELWRRLLQARPKNTKGQLEPLKYIMITIDHMTDKEQNGLLSALAYMPEEVPNIFIRKMVSLNWVEPQEYGLTYEDLGMEDPEAVENQKFEFDDEEEDNY